MGGDMGEMSVRSRPRKDLAASFNRMKRMVGDIKSARKSLAAHHSFIAELVSVSLFPAIPSSKASSPRSPPYHPQLDDSQEVGNGSTPFQSPVLCSAPPSRKPAKPSHRSPPCNLQLDDLQEVRIGSPLLQLDDLQEVGITSSILQSPIPCSVLPSANSTLSSLASRISASLPPSVQSGHLQASCTSPSQLSCNFLEEVDSVSNKIFMLPCHSIAANPGKLAAQPAYWASLLFVFLCFFLCIGKEVAVGLTITANFIIWITFKGPFFLKQMSRYIFPSCDSEECYVQDKQSSHLNRSLTIPTHGNAIFFSSESRFCTRSQSLSTLHGCAMEEVYTSEPGLSIYSASSVASLSNVGICSARLKPGIMLVLALCGLAHGQIMAVCMCSCCVLIFSEMQRLASKKCKQEIQNNIQCSC